MGTVIFVFLLDWRYTATAAVTPPLLLWRVNEGGRKQKGIAVLGPNRVTKTFSQLCVCGLIYVFYCNRLCAVKNGKM